jgi:hypothetical protein
MVAVRASMSLRSWSVMGFAGLGERACDVLQGQGVFADFDEVVQLLCVQAVQPVLKADQQAVEPPGQVLVIRRNQGHDAGWPRRLACADLRS